MFDLFGNPIQTTYQCSVVAQNGAWRVQTPYNAGFVAALKALPSTARRYDPQTRTWLVDTQYANEVKRLIHRFFGEDIGDLGDLVAPANNPELELRVCDVWYLGRTKPAGDEYQASGMNAQKEWVFIFPESALRNWFEGSAKYTNTTTLYSILGIQRTATDDEIKSAYRRMVRQWHPDVCKEPNAQEMFIRIKEAYELLNNPEKRARYDAGLALEASLQQNVDKLPDKTGYRSPLRCGYILAEGYERLGRFHVQKIMKWEDITSDKGTLVASWPSGATEPVWKWV